MFHFLMHEAPREEEGCHIVSFSLDFLHWKSSFFTVKLETSLKLYRFESLIQRNWKKKKLKSNGKENREWKMESVRVAKWKIIREGKEDWKLYSYEEAKWRKNWAWQHPALLNSMLSTPFVSAIRCVAPSRRSAATLNWFQGFCLLY